MPGGGHRPAAGPSGPPLVYLVDRGEPAAVAAVVEYQPEDGEPIPVTRVEVSTGLDVAVLHLQRPAPAVLPAAGQVTAGEQWRVDTRPDPGAPVLRGTVTEPQRQLKNAAGKETTLIQLWVEQEIGGYQGYSGSPVIAQSAGGVLGVLVEQAFWRVSRPAGRSSAPVANVLFAAPIDGVLAEFDLAGVPVARSVRDIPRPVSFEVRRPDQLNQVLDALIAAPSDGQLVGLAGMGGSGKSVLAAAAARDPKVRRGVPGRAVLAGAGPGPAAAAAAGQPGRRPGGQHADHRRAAGPGAAEPPARRAPVPARAGQRVGPGARARLRRGRAAVPGAGHHPRHRHRSPRHRRAARPAQPGGGHPAAGWLGTPPRPATLRRRQPWSRGNAGTCRWPWPCAAR